MGTKFKLDLVTNANIFMEPVWPELELPEAAAAHRGYLGRSRGVPIEHIHRHALQQGKRLVLCGAPVLTTVNIPEQTYPTYPISVDSP